MKKSFRHAADRMISGKLRKKRAGRGGSNESTTTIEGTSYIWSYRHGWQVWGKDIKAISISVALDPGRTRELILDFTFEVVPPATHPHERVVAQAVDAGIRSALEAGWDPESRGRAFRYDAAEHR
jgi:hypothetical protein